MPRIGSRPDVINRPLVVDITGRACIFPHPSHSGCDCTRTATSVESPESDTSAIELEVDENTATNTNIVSPVPALDPESDEMTYSLVGSDSHWFDVDNSSGQIKGLLDHESPVDNGADNVYETPVITPIVTPRRSKRRLRRRSPFPRLARRT